MGNKQHINIKEFVNKACEKYGLDPNGIIARAYEQGVFDLTKEVKRIIENEEEVPYEEIKDSENSNNQ